MASADQLKSLIKSYGENDDDRFFASAMQIAASEARKGHSSFAQELKIIIEKARKNRSLTFLDRSKTIPIYQSKRELHELIDVFQPKIKLGDMILASSVNIALDRIINEQRNWQELQKHDLMPRRKLLLKGPPGCGKTMTAQAIAGELGIPVFIVRLDGLISKYMGESIAKLRLIFDAMQDHRGVYLFDEFDSIGSKRHYGHDVGEIKRVLNSFLMYIEKDNSYSIIIAATNLPELLDDALFRRFDDIISYPMPNKKEIIETMSKSLSGFSEVGKVELDSIAKQAQGLNFSDIVRACEEAIKDVILRGEKRVNKQVLLRALKDRKG